MKSSQLPKRYHFHGFSTEGKDYPVFFEPINKPRQMVEAEWLYALRTYGQTGTTKQYIKYLRGILDKRLPRDFVVENNVRFTDLWTAEFPGQMGGIAGELAEDSSKVEATTDAVELKSRSRPEISEPRMLSIDDSPEENPNPRPTRSLSI